MFPFVNEMTAAQNPQSISTLLQLLASFYLKTVSGKVQKRKKKETCFSSGGNEKVTSSPSQIFTPFHLAFVCKYHHIT